MKVDVCLKCNRFFRDNFSYCPFCGEKLKAYDMTKIYQPSESKNTTPKVTKSVKKDLPLLDEKLKKKLPPKPNPKSVFLTGYSPNCKTSSAEGNKTRKMQKDIWKD